MDKDLNKAFNLQMNYELYSAYLYLGMSEWLMRHGWIGASHWMAVQAREEVTHAEGLMRWVQRHDGEVELPAIDAVEIKFDSVLDVFEQALAHEKQITENINKLVEASKKSADRASKIFLDWYVMEQVEEEENARDNILGIQLCKDDRAALIAWDHGMMQREFHHAEIPYLD